MVINPTLLAKTTRSCTLTPPLLLERAIELIAIHSRVMARSKEEGARLLQTMVTERKYNMSGAVCMLERVLDANLSRIG
jgi:hypothetical protein